MSVRRSPRLSKAFAALGRLRARDAATAARASAAELTSPVAPGWAVPTPQYSTAWASCPDAAWSARSVAFSMRWKA